MTKVINFTQLKRKQSYDFWREMLLEHKYKFTKYQLNDTKGHLILNVIDFINYIIRCNYRDLAFPDESSSIRQNKLAALKKQENLIKLSYDSSRNDINNFCSNILISRIEHELKNIFQVEYQTDCDKELKEEKTVLVEEHDKCTLTKERHLYRINRLEEFKNKSAKVVSPSMSED